MIWVLFLVLFVDDGDVFQMKEKTIPMNDEAECRNYESKWAEKFSEHPNVLWHECKGIPLPKRQPQLKKERDS
jgi:hypothetical protein